MPSTTIEVREDQAPFVTGKVDALPDLYDMSNCDQVLKELRRELNAEELSFTEIDREVKQGTAFVSEAVWIKYRVEPKGGNA